MAGGNEVEEYIKLWTCENGLQLMNDNRQFCAWEKDLANDFPVKVKFEFATKDLRHEFYHIKPQGVVEVCGHVIDETRARN